MVHHNGTNPDIPSPYIASISFSWIFKDFSIAASRFLHRKRNKSISPQRLPHSRIYFSYVSHATVEICSRENLEVVSASGIRIKLAACGRRLLFRRLSVPSISRPTLVFLFIFFPCIHVLHKLTCISYEAMAGATAVALDARHSSWREIPVTCVVRAHTLPITCGLQLRIN